MVPFDEKYDSLLQAIAGQAAIAIENNRLMRQIQTQFEEFVRASVVAIESGPGHFRTLFQGGQDMHGHGQGDK